VRRWWGGGAELLAHICLLTPTMVRVGGGDCEARPMQMEGFCIIFGLQEWGSFFHEYVR
jgi:hypothetical protein